MIQRRTQEWKGRVKKALALTLILALTMSLILVCQPNHQPDKGKIYAAELDTLQSAQEKLSADIDSAKAEAARLADQQKELNLELEKLKSDKKLAEARCGELQEDLKKAANNLTLAMTRYENAIKNLKQQQTDYASRIQALFRVRQKSTLETLLESDNLGDFFSRMRLMAYIGESDQRQLEKLKSAEDEAEQAKKTAETTKKEYERYIAEQKKTLSGLKQGIDLAQTSIEANGTDILRVNGDIHNMESQKVYNDAALVNLRQQAREGWLREQAAEAATAAPETTAATSTAAPPETTSAAAQASEQGGASGKTSSPTTTAAPTTTEAPAKPVRPAAEHMIYPLANYRDISSYFGWRPDPFGGSGMDFHWGLDFPAPAGTPIRASLSGKVVRAEEPLPGATYGGSNFGNVVAIMSPDGRMITYGHMKRLYVSLGQQVAQGDVIGEVGSTGYSTGPHVHFQLSVPWTDADGVDPLPYLQG